MRLLVYNRLDFQTKQSEHYILIWYTFHKDLVVWIFFFFLHVLAPLKRKIIIKEGFFDLFPSSLPRPAEIRNRAVITS
jgi:hypothetical protein